MAHRIPTTVVTGFLGAGKTSLIRHIVENSGGRRLAFLINEFGDLGVDRELLLGCGIEGCDEDDVVELANGCICCTVADDFVPAMEKLLARDELPDHIIIETSGLALPKPLVQAFNWPEIRANVTVDGVIAVIDAAAVDEGRFADDPEAVEAQRSADSMLDHESPVGGSVRGSIGVRRHGDPQQGRFIGGIGAPPSVRHNHQPNSQRCFRRLDGACSDRAGAFVGPGCGSRVRLEVASIASRRDRRRARSR